MSNCLCFPCPLWALSIVFCTLMFQCCQRDCNSFPRAFSAMTVHLHHASCYSVLPCQFKRPFFLLLPGKSFVHVIRFVVRLPVMFLSTIHVSYYTTHLISVFRASCLEGVCRHDTSSPIRFILFSKLFWFCYNIWDKMFTVLFLARLLFIP